MKNFLLIVFFCLSYAANAANLNGALESPAEGSIQSGIGIVRGWHCSASVIEVTIDGVSQGKTYVGSNRLDATQICGKVETGYSLLINYNDSKIKPGSHILRVYGDGNLFGMSNFQNLQSGGQEYLTGVNKQVSIVDFPRIGSSVIASWQEDKQNFAITGISLNQLQTSRVTASSVTFLNGSDGATRIGLNFTNNTNQFLGKVDFDIFCTSGSTGLTFLKSTSFIPAAGMLYPGATEAASIFYYSPNMLRQSTPHCANINSDVYISPTSIYNAVGALIY